MISRLSPTRPRWPIPVGCSPASRCPSTSSSASRSSSPFAPERKKPPPRQRKGCRPWPGRSSGVTVAAQRSFIGVIVKRGFQGIVAAVVLWLAGRFVFHFPPVLHVMVVLYAFLGTGAFILLDAPSLSPVSGIKAVALLVGFYVVISLVFIDGARALQQLDPMVEKGMIETIVKP